jgi:hypothetical protein
MEYVHLHPVHSAERMTCPKKSLIAGSFVEYMPTKVTAFALLSRSNVQCQVC